ncbi:MAG: alpha/beta fold hydrolase, partial [Thermoanaerobaculia bacterium]
KSSATSIHALMKLLGVEKARVVGHDIGLMVAYAYAAQYWRETEKLVLMDAFLPGVAGWEDVYNNPGIWHFRFNGPTPEALVSGRERIYLDHYWNDFAADPKHSIPEAEREAYTASYARPGRMRAGWAYFIAFPQTARDFAALAKNRLEMPVLAIGGDKANGALLGKQANAVASRVKVVVLKDTGHWLMEENPEATIDALRKFLEE